jgi:hypothetical protein
VQREVGKRPGLEGLSFYLLAHIALSAENKELRKLCEVLYPEPMKLLTVKITVGSSSQTEALIDGGLQLNLISAVLAKEQGLTIDPLLELLAEGVNRSEIPVYGTTTAGVTITDSHGRVQTYCVPFVVTDLWRYQVYLSLSWIDAACPKLSYASQRMLF